MNEKRKIKKILTNPWVYTTGGGVFTLLFIRLIDHLFGVKTFDSVWNFIKNIFLSFFAFLSTEYKLGLWFLITIFIVGLIFPFIVLFIIAKFEKNGISIKNPVEPTWLIYKEDKFGMLLFRWKYQKNILGNYEIENIMAYCPDCKCQLIGFQCPNCGLKFYQEYSNSQIIALIIHRIETKKDNV